MRIIKQYKFLGTGLKSKNGNLKWKIGEWKKFSGKLEMCKAGFHSCKEPYDAFSYVQGEILAEVECRGKRIKGDNKDCWQEQRIVKACKWTKKDSLKLAIYSAELVLKNFEKEYPDDSRPRKAIEAAKNVLFKDTKKNRDAARSAAESAARSAAESAAWSAAWSAAESAAWSAARSAAWSAESAAESAAWSAAWSAADSAAIKKIQKYFKEIVKDLKPYGRKTVAQE